LKVAIFIGGPILQKTAVQRA